jgi:flavin-dependent dehydrogenase
MACGRRGYVGLVRVEEDRLNLAAALDPEWAKQSGGVDRASIRLLVEAGVDPPASPAAQSWQATPLLTRQASRVAAPRLLVVGDAAGYVEPFTGEGMAWALASGRAVVSVISEVRVGWDAEMERGWTRIHRRLVGHRQRVCRGVAWLLRRPQLLRYACDFLHLRPGAARPLIRHLNRPFH